MKEDIDWNTNDNNLLTELMALENDERISFSKLLKIPQHAIINLISAKLNSKNARQIIYHIKQNSIDIPNCKCGMPLAWHPDLRAYRKYCSKSCSAKFSIEITKQNNLLAFGKAWHSQTNEWQDKVKATSLRKFGAEHYTKTQQYKDQVRLSNLAKYNVTHTMLLTDTKQKIAQTNLIRYGFINPMLNDIIKNKVKNTNNIRYGVDNPMHNAIIKNKVKNTNIARYGCANPLNNKIIRAKSINTFRNNYYTTDTASKINDVKWLTDEHNSGKTIGEIANDIGVSASNLCKIFQSLGIEVVHHPASELERRLNEYYRTSQLTLVNNTRSIIPPKELDLYFPEKKLAIEVNGCYYHSEKFNRFEQYHLLKTDSCIALGIELLQFWDFELNTKWDQVTNLINSKLGLGDRIYARRTVVKDIQYINKKDFINANHLQGDVSSSINIGLFDINEQLVMVATFGKPRFTKRSNTFELLRLCSTAGLQVVGGASKLIKHFIKYHMNTNDELISYCNRRYSIGNVYNKLGFELASISPPGFFYITKAGKYAGSRYQWQKHLMKDKLANFNPLLTANQNMTNHGFDKVWDCGQYVFKLMK